MALLQLSDDNWREDLRTLDLPDWIKDALESALEAKKNGKPGPMIGKERFEDLAERIVAVQLSPSGEQYLPEYHKGRLCLKYERLKESAKIRQTPLWARSF